MEARLWLASHEQRCPLVRQAYVAVLRLLRENCSRAFLLNLGSLLMKELHRTPHTLEVQKCLHFAIRQNTNEDFKYLKRFMCTLRFQQDYSQQAKVMLK